MSAERDRFTATEEEETSGEGVAHATDTVAHHQGMEEIAGTIAIAVTRETHRGVRVGASFATSVDTSRPSAQNEAAEAEKDVTAIPCTTAESQEWTTGAEGTTGVTREGTGIAVALRRETA